MSPEIDVFVIHMQAGDEQQAAKAALTANQVVEKYPRARLMLSIDGFDNDPRELDQIPEGLLSLKTVFSHLHRDTFFRFERDHRALLLLGAGFAVRSGGDILTSDFMLDESRMS